ncbi:FG-GAP repeat domain-containing protein [Polyangium jinanense]|uniref:VCBS repeat-containing protein n=1 Tax=Polyangium jinanense TaxID=2829994 RepID=A0A9X4ASI6_9BACT|nr:VCBS repeat-containing protein [Polyangium jinanense]MDC3954998.1 VCBS repeat-containing protein [Polyangium jinanense]MDC3981232.1 VCBS repeat-containing protein [Polyangium jinanense]
MKSSAASMIVLGAMMAFGEVTPDGGDDGWKIVMAADFNFDGMADVLWNDTHDNLFSVWLMEGTVPRAPGPVIAGPPGDGWSVKAAGDFNQDGMADVLWINTNRNRFAIWLMNGASVLAPGPEILGPAGDDWTLASVSDFNFDGRADVVFHQAKTNLFSVWLMNGATVLARGPALHGPIGDEWSVSMTADFNGDRLDDIVWIDVTNQRMAIWLMNGTTLLARGPSVSGLLGSGWSLVRSAGDVNFDGMADLLWTKDQPSLFTVWRMGGTSLLGQGPLVAGPEDDGWSIATIGDLNGDGTVDLVWQAQNPPRMAAWVMRGTSVAMAGPVIQGPNAP